MDKNKTEQIIDFGAADIPRNEKQDRVREVFDSVAAKYDMMNDVMSLGIHRIWKNTLIRMIAPNPNMTLIDLAGGTGDIAAKFLKSGGGHATVIDINPEMIRYGQQRPQMAALKNLDWVLGNAEEIPIKDNTAEVVTIAFGLRNVTDREKAIAEAYRILKPNGRFFCLEFSHVRQQSLAKLYDLWSGFLPQFGEIIAKDAASYTYLVESIRRFPNQEELAAAFGAAGFARVKCRDLIQGIAAIHCGWKIG